jgi:hypothetical protein
VQQQQQQQQQQHQGHLLQLLAAVLLWDVHWQAGVLLRVSQRDLLVVVLLSQQRSQQQLQTRRMVGASVLVLALLLPLQLLKLQQLQGSWQR